MRLARTLAVALVTLLAVGSAQAVTRSMGGLLGVVNPSTANVFERGPDISFGSIEAAGTTPATAVGRTLTLPAGQFLLQGSQFRSFPGFAGVAQLSFNFTTTQQAAQFRPGGGAAAAGSISFCPPQNNSPPASGTGTGGNRSCTFFNNEGTGNWKLRIGIAGGGYGGVLKLLRNVTGAVWFVVGTPTPTNNIGVVSRQPNSITNQFWTPGQTNYNFERDVNLPGPNYNAVVTPTFGRVGTVLTSLGLGTVDPDDGSGWGFKLTTGTLSGSDIYPPNVSTPAPSHFFFTSMGRDWITPGGQRNIVLLGGAVARSGTGGNLFFRNTQLKMTIPEPATGIGLVASVGLLLGLARAQRRR